MPVFGGWLRNVETRTWRPRGTTPGKLRQRSEQIGFDLSLIAELNLNDIKGLDSPSLDAWSTSAALAAVTKTLELMVAVRPTFHSPALFAKQAANIDHISEGRLALNVVSSWWEQEHGCTASISTPRRSLWPYRRVAGCAERGLVAEVLRPCGNHYGPRTRCSNQAGPQTEAARSMPAANRKPRRISSHRSAMPT